MRISEAILGTTDGGSSWTTQTAPSGVVELSGIECPSTSVCEAQGVNSSSFNGVVFGTTNGGSSWAAQTLPTVQSYLGDVTCVSASVCELSGESASGASVLGTTNGGSTWTARHCPLVRVIPAKSPALRLTSARWWRIPIPVRMKAWGPYSVQLTGGLLGAHRPCLQGTRTSPTLCVRLPPCARRSDKTSQEIQLFSARLTEDRPGPRRRCPLEQPKSPISSAPPSPSVKRWGKTSRDL